MSQLSRYCTILFTILLTSYAGRVSAAGSPQWLYCPTPNIPPPTKPHTDSATRLSADQIDANPKGITRLDGGVVIERGGEQIRGDRGSYHRPSDRAELMGNVALNSPQIYVRGERAHYQPAARRGEIFDVDYTLRSARARGSAQQITFGGDAPTLLREASFTSCPESEAGWQLKASEVTLDRSSNTGEAYNTTLWFMGVPFFYTPYLNFPLAGRKSGLLTPSYDISENNGTDIRLPVYWNIAPHRDATLTLRNITARGPMVESEFRYLNPTSHGELQLDYLPEDKRREATERHRYRLTHKATFSERLNGTLLFNEVSDPAYFDDLGQGQAVNSQSHLERRVDLDYQRNDWRVQLLGQHYQTLSGTSPYQRLPQLRFSYLPPSEVGRPHFQLESEWVEFRHEARRPIGRRIDLYPALSLPLEGAAWFLKPRLALRHTRYQLTEVGSEQSAVSIERTLPITTLDSGIFLERETLLGDLPLLHTLEPRLYYLYVPHRDQDAIPLFDTGNSSFSYEQLFRDNRFSGVDRIGDTNQLTLAVTTRFLHGHSGAELFRASLGQIRYFDDRRVTLRNNETAQGLDRSAYLAELALQPLSTVRFSSSSRWNPDTEKTELFSSRLTYRPRHDRSLYLNYQLQGESVKRADVALFWPLATPRLRFLGRWQRDMLTERDLDVVYGLEYQSCCWAARLVGRETLNTTTQELEHSLFFSLELKGLSSIGNRIDDAIEGGLLGIER